MYLMQNPLSLLSAQSSKINRKVQWTSVQQIPSCSHPAFLVPFWEIYTYYYKILCGFLSNFDQLDASVSSTSVLKRWNADEEQRLAVTLARNSTTPMAIFSGLKRDERINSPDSLPDVSRWIVSHIRQSANDILPRSVANELY